MKSLTFDEIMQIDDLEREKIHIPEWGKDAHFYVRMLRGDELDAFEQEISSKNGSVKAGVPFRAALSARCLVNEKGDRVVPDSRIKQFATKSGAAINRIFEVACRLNKYTAKDVEELEGNSESAP